jgi:hypothetical protein
MVDACLVTIAAINKAYPDEGKRTREWEKMAKSAGIEIIEDPEVTAARRDRMLAAMEAEFGDDG